MLAMESDLATKRDALFALSGISDSPELQGDLIKEGIILVIGEAAKCGDARVQRDAARMFSNLAQVNEQRLELINQGALPAVLVLAKSLDIASQRYATLTLCNLCSSDLKVTIVEAGAIRPLIFLAR